MRNAFALKELQQLGTRTKRICFEAKYNSSICQCRNYAIMTRAKLRAGISTTEPIRPIPTTTVPKTNIDKRILKASDINPAAATVKQKQHVEKSISNEAAVGGGAEYTSAAKVESHIPKDKISLLKPKNELKPAGIEQRLVTVPKEVIQPKDPYLIKVAVIGAANAGKSTIVNKLVKAEVSGVSPKAHTTRERVLAVLTEGNYQVVFLDTPGVIADPKIARKNSELASVAWRSLDEADHLMVIVSAERAVQPQARAAEEYILKQLSNVCIPATLIINKMDLIEDNRDLLESVVGRYYEGYKHFTTTLYASALFNDGLQNVKDALFSKALPAPWIYPATQTTDMAPLRRVEDIIRVEFFKRLNYHLPYSLRQENVGWTENEEDGSLTITQNIYVERDSQQKIIIGSKGRIITSVIQEARQRIADALKKSKVQLFIKIKTKKR